MDVPGTSSTSSLSRRIVLWAGFALFVLLAGLGWAGRRLIRDRVLRQADSGVQEAAEHAALAIEHALAERERQVQMLASLPAVVDDARRGAERARQLGLAAESLDVAERRFDSTRTLDIDPRTRAFLIARSVLLDLAEVLVTDRHGFNVVTTERTSDFVQSDEEWWRRALADGLTPAEAAYDESARRVTISVASAVRETDGAEPVGVMKVVYGLGPLQEAVNVAASADSIQVDLIDGQGRVVVSSGSVANLALLPGAASLPRTSASGVVRYSAGAIQRASLLTSNRNAWRVVAHLPESLPLGEIRRGTTTLGLIGAGVFVLLTGALFGMDAFMSRRIAQPAALLALAAESVAAGDLSITVKGSGTDDELGRLSRAVRSMIDGLRKLALTIKQSAQDTAAMAVDLTANSEQIAASSQQMAMTSADLSQRSSEMVQTIQEMAGAATKLLELASGLATGVAEGVTRNQQLRGFASENRGLLDSSIRDLEALVQEAQRSSAAAEALAAASEEIREFVFLVQNIARQSKLLAFSAGLEASRAGKEGTGFTVVANEVERLASSSAEAAERTEKVVSALLLKVEETRASSARSALAVEKLRNATQQGLSSFRQVEGAIGETEAWTVEIERASLLCRSVVADTTKRLDALSSGTEAFAAAMQEVAASAQEQTASTEEVATTAAELSSAADRLSAQAAAFRLEEQRSAE